MADVENKQVTTKRDSVLERLKSRYPDKNFADDESIYGQINEDYDANDAELAGYKEREAGLVDLFSKNPSFAQFVAEAANGEDPWISVIKHLGIDGITDILNNPEKQKEYAEANADFVQRLAKEKELEEEYNKNLDETLSVLEEIQKEKGLSDEQMDAAYALIKKIAAEAIVGKFTRESVEMALNALNHDADVETARTEGTIAGKNAKVEETLRKKKEGDVPLGGGGGNAPTQPKKSYSIFDEARGAN